MRHHLLGCAGAIAAAAIAFTPAAALKKGPYPEVKVEIADAYTPDPEFTAMLKALNNAIAKKDATAFSALVGPTFVWTFEGGPNQLFDMGRDALHNFKVAFGFRMPDKDQDGGVEDGPYWDGLAELAAETRFYQPPGAGNLVCGPIAAEPVDQAVFDKATKQLETPDEPVEWYFTFGDTAVAKAPGDTGAPVAKVGKVALPVVSTHPPAPAQGPAPPTTHVEVLLTSGRTGWVPAASMTALTADRLCFSKIPGGAWRISSVDQNRN